MSKVLPNRHWEEWENIVHQITGNSRVNNILLSKNHPPKVGWYFCESLFGGDAVDNSSSGQEDGSVMFNEDLLILMVECVNFSK